MILIRDVPGAVERAPTLHGAETKLMDKIEADWGGMCRLYAEAYGLPDGWLQAMIFQESGGNPDARNPEANKGPEDDGLGLLQITHPSLKGRRRIVVDGQSRWIGGRTDAELLVPSTNLDIGAKYLAQHYKRIGNDFPRNAAAFNAGSDHPPSDKDHENPWWLHSTGNHVSREVAALNYWIQAFAAKPDLEQPQLISLVALAREEDERARRDTEPPGAA